MQHRQITLINKLGLHARAAAKFVQTASAYTCDVSVQFNNKKVSGKSIMGLMMLAAACGTHLEIFTEGDNELEAMTALEQLIQGRFGESE